MATADSTKLKISALPRTTAKTAYGLLGDVARLILDEPKRYDQRIYIDRPGDEDQLIKTYPACGTVCCVAGWVAVLTNGRDVAYSNVLDIATDALGIGGAQALELFRSDAVKGDPQTAAYAKGGVKHIAQFRKKYRKQLQSKRLSSSPASPER